LIDFAKHYVGNLTVLACSIKDEPIPGKLRLEWMRQLFPNVNIIEITDEIPQDPKDHPDFWNIWKNTIKREIPGDIDYVFASEDYGFQLAEILDAKYIPVDHAREIVPVSGTQIRENPMKNWDYMPKPIRPHFLKRVCIFGPESTGKSTLTKNLAAHFNTVYVAEYARGLLDLKNGQCDYEDIERIARGHRASELALAPHANRVLFSDTDMVLTTIWSDVFFKKCPEWVTQNAEGMPYDLYLLTDIDVPWVEDIQRYFPDEKPRRDFMDHCIKTLEERKLPYIRISGSWDERLKSAIEATEKLIKP
jgi:NadR type nicotinamide-nucleotide adenylyltransferase